MTFRISVSGWLPMGGTESPLRHRTRQKTHLLREKGAAARSHATVSAAGRTRGAQSARQAAKPRPADHHEGIAKPFSESSEVCRCRRGEGEEVKRIHALTHWTGRRTSSSNFTSGFRILL